MWANYIDNVWGQMKLGLMSAELRATYLALIERFVQLHPAVAQQMSACSSDNESRLSALV
jgi:hypothetical protein